MSDEPFGPTVPDAATEELARIKPLFENYSREYPNECNKRVKAEAERDAALAAIERVRARLGDILPDWSDSGVIAVADILAALDGAPEPEWEEQTTYGSQLESGYITIEMRGPNYSTHQRTVRRGPWLPLKGESE